MPDLAHILDQLKMIKGISKSQVVKEALERFAQEMRDAQGTLDRRHVIKKEAEGREGWEVDSNGMVREVRTRARS